MEITLLPPHSAAATPDTLFCLLTTRNTPEPETTCDIYGEDWQRVKSIPTTPFAASLTAKPDTMDLTEYSRLQKLIEMPSSRPTSPTSPQRRCNSRYTSPCSARKTGSG